MDIIRFIKSIFTPKTPVLLAKQINHQGKTPIVPK